MIGIDLGTTNSLVSIWDNDRVRIIPNSLGENTTPSVVSLDEGGDILVGKPAKERLITHPAQSAAFFKRYMGSDKIIPLGKNTFRPVELSALVLKSLKKDARDFLHKPINEAVISVPAYFNDVQRKTTKAAGQIAGLDVKCLINEPTAAAIAYGLHEKKEFSKFIVLDLGGGTFDVSILEYFSGVMEVHASAGDTFLGGEDFTDVILNHCLEASGLNGSTIDKKSMFMVRRQAERCKLELSRKQNASIKLSNRNLDIDWKITRDKFQAVTERLVERMRFPIERAIRDSNLEVRELDAVILVGGATRMPMIRNMVGKMFCKLPYSTINPDEVVCHGAGIQAGLKSKHHFLKEVVLTDVCPYTLGIDIIRPDGSGGLEGGYFMPVIERSSTVPLSRAQRVTTVYDNQSSIQVGIYQGESRWVRNNVKLGEMKIEIPSAPAGEPEIDIRFTYDANGLLEVDIDVKDTNIKANLLIENTPGMLTKDRIKKCLEKVAGLKIHPRDNMANRALVAKGERLYEEALGEKRVYIADLLSAFDRVLEGQNEHEIRRAYRLLVGQLNEIAELEIIE